MAAINPRVELAADELAAVLEHPRVRPVVKGLLAEVLREERAVEAKDTWTTLAAYLNIAPSAARMRIRRSPALRQAAVRVGRELRFRRSVLDEIFSTGQAAAATVGRSREVLQRARATRRGRAR